MPMIDVRSSVELDDASTTQLLSSLSRLCSEQLGKPETYVMTMFSPAAISMAGERRHAAFVDLRSIGGLSAQKNKELSSALCSLLGEQLGLNGEHIYLNFADVARTAWGYDGGTLG